MSLQVVATTTGTVNNTTGTISANESGSGATSNTASLTATPAPIPPTLAKAFSPKIVAVGPSAALTFTVTNPNSSTEFEKTAFTDTLPAGLVVASPNGVSGTCVATDKAVVTANAGSSSISLSSLNLPGSASCTLSVNVAATAAGTMNNTTSSVTASFDRGDGTLVGITGSPASASLAVVAPTIAKAFSPSTVVVNQTTSLTFTVSNLVGNATLHNLSFTDTFPSHLAVASTPGVGGTCVGNGTITATAAATQVSYSGGVLSGGSSCTISVNVTPGAAAVMNNTAGPLTSTETPSLTATGSATLTVLSPRFMNANTGTSPQSAQVTQAFGTLLAVTVLASDGTTPAPGTVVTFTAPASGASGTFANGTATTQATTNSSGIATATTFTANAQVGGPCHVSATAAGLPTVNFALTNTAGPPAQMSANTRTTPQSATVNTSFAVPLAVTVSDAHNNPVSGVAVHFSAPVLGASGSFANRTATTQATTNSGGIATATTFTADRQAGGAPTM